MQRDQIESPDIVSDSKCPGDDKGDYSEQLQLNDDTSCNVDQVYLFNFLFLYELVI